MEKVNVGIIGCGAISSAYLEMAARFPILNIVALADLNPAAAQARAQEFGISRTSRVEELIDDPSIEIVLNLTIPKAHAAIAVQCLAAGKHTYSEKPLGISREEGRSILAAAAERKLRVGCAPDTFMGAGIQTARKLLDDGTIGRPVAFTAFMMGRGHESWHPNPEFYYQPGGGPMFDMGPYYLTALLNLFGPIKRLSGMASIAIPQRTITSPPKAGTKIRVETPDHVVGTIEFENGAVGAIIQTFSTYHPAYDKQQPITVYGDEGTLKVPDPNTFDGPVQVKLAGDTDWRHVSPAFTTGYGRSVGLADMAYAIRSGRAHRASGELAFAVLDAMLGFLESSESGTFCSPSLRPQRPSPMPTSWLDA